MTGGGHREEHDFVTERTTDTDGALTTELVDGGKQEPPAGRARGGGQRLKVRLPLLGVQEWAGAGWSRQRRLESGGWIMGEVGRWRAA